MEDNTCESFELLKTLDLPHISARIVEPKSSLPITSESPNSAPQPMSPNSKLRPASVTHSSPKFSQVYSRRKTIPELTQVQESNLDFGNEIMVRPDPPLHTQIVETSNEPTNDLDLPVAVRKSTRECTKRPLYLLAHYVSLKHLSPTHKKFIASLNTITIPNTVSEALSKREWRDAMKEEMSALQKNKIWEIVDKPKGKNIVDCKWIFTLKYKFDGSLERYKARLVARGYIQIMGLIIKGLLLLLQK
ncbi:hypothetical protein ACH5RR_000472 [Cinchona calisaya]|uniref:Reverse transcriptase Ty1/copia-type domain-containing protein n=1 Tax=Cinchona calisaya TaxID=153742 RepID=A0ABD3B0Z0_9GENT